MIEAVISLGPNIFYGTQLAPYILILKNKKEEYKKNKVLFIDASDEISVGRAQSYLEQENVKKIFEWYQKNENIDNYSNVVSIEEIKENEYSLNIPLYVEKLIEDNLPSKEDALSELKSVWNESLEADRKFKDLLKEFIS